MKKVKNNVMSIISNIRRSRGGFTLVELIVVIVIIGILAGGSAAGIIQYQRWSVWQRQENYAKTLFTAAQSALTQYSSSGELEDMAKLVKKGGATLISDGNNMSVGITDREGNAVSTADIWKNAEQKGELYAITGTPQDYKAYLAAGENADRKDIKTILYDIFNDYLYDKSILSEGCVNLEFDPSEGMVYSVVYSDRADGLSYGAGAGTINICDRSRAARKGKDGAEPFGYYGVDTLAVSATGSRPVITNVKLNNEEALYLSWQLSDSRKITSDISNELSSLDYQIIVYDARTDEAVLKLEHDGNAAIVQSTADDSSKLIEFSVMRYGTSGEGDGTDDSDDGTDLGTYRFRTYIGSDENGDPTAYLVLDALDLAATEAKYEALRTNGIGSDSSGLKDTLSMHRFALEELGVETIYCTLQASGTGARVSALRQSNVEHMYYDDYKLSDAETNKIYEISNARHLYNVRFTEAAAELNGGTDGVVTFSADDRTAVNEAEPVDYRVTKSFAWGYDESSTNDAKNPDGTDIVSIMHVKTGAGSYDSFVFENGLMARESAAQEDAPSYAAFPSIKTLRKDCSFSAKLSAKDERLLGEGADEGETESENGVKGYTIDYIYLSKADDSEDVGSKLNEEATEPAALFTDNSGEISALTLDHLTVIGEDYTAGVCAVNAGTLSDIEITKNSTISGRYYVGGFAASDASDKRSNNSIDNSNGTEAGSTAAYACLVNSAKIKGTAYIGGIAGALELKEGAEAELEQCENHGVIMVDYDSRPAAATEMKHEVPYAGTANSGSGTGYTERYNFYVGGIVGYACADESSSLKLTDCTSYPKLKADDETSDADSGAALSTEDIKNTYMHGIYVGGIAGYAENTVISGCSSLNEEAGQACIAGYAYVGGIVGLATGNTSIKAEGRTTENDSTEEGVDAGINAGVNEAQVYGYAYVGGIAGANAQLLKANAGEAVTERASALSNALGEGDVTNNAPSVLKSSASDNETSNEASIDGMTNKGSVTAYAAYAGGIAGFNTKVIVDCTSLAEGEEDGKSEGESDTAESDAKIFYVGGIAGYNNGKITAAADRLKLYVDADAEGFAGGIAGFNDADGEISASYELTGKAKAKVFAGGIAGFNASVELQTKESTVSFAKGFSVSAGYMAGGAFGATIVDTAKIGPDTVISYDQSAYNADVSGFSLANSSESSDSSDSDSALSSAFIGGFTGYYAAVSGIGGAAANQADASVGAQIDYTAQYLAGELNDSSMTLADAVDVLKLCEENYSSEENSEGITIVSVDGTSADDTSAGDSTESAYVNTVSGGIYVGGVVGYCEWNSAITFKGIENRRQVVAADAIRGTIEDAAAAETADGIDNENSEGNVSFAYAGAILGKVTPYVTIDSCTALEEGRARAEKADYKGGLAEVNYGIIKDCVVKDIGSEEDADGHIGGLVGVNMAGDESEGSSEREAEGGLIKDCSVEGTVVGTEYVGGLASENFGEISGAALTDGAVIKAAGESKGMAAGGITAFSHKDAVISFTSEATDDGETGGNVLAGKVEAEGKYAGLIAAINEGNVGISGAAEVAGYIVNSSSAEVRAADCAGGFFGEQKFNGASEQRLEGFRNYASVTASKGYAAGIAAVVNTANAEDNSDESENGNEDIDESAALLVIKSCENYGKITAGEDGGGQSVIADDVSETAAAGIIASTGLKVEVEGCLNAKDAEVIALSDGAAAGGIVVHGKGSITDSHNEGTVSDAAEAGGIAVSIEGTIAECSNKGKVDAKESAGGIAVIAKGGIAKCSNEGEVSAEESAGGVAIDVYGGIGECSNEGEVNAKELAGGIAVSVTGGIVDCENRREAQVSADGGDAAGIAVSFLPKAESDKNDESNPDNEPGLDEKNNDTDESIEYTENTIKGSVNFGKVTAVGGGAAGIAVSLGKDCTAEECANSGEVSALASDDNAEANAGGIAVTNEGTIVSCENTAASSENGEEVGAVQVTAAGAAAGIAVFNIGKIEKCENGEKAEISADKLVGGIAADNTGNIAECKNIGGLSSDKGTAGGIAGLNEDLEGTEADDDSTESVGISECENYGSVTAMIAGGISGTNEGVITKSRNLAEITAESDSQADAAAGGISGENSGDIKECSSFASVSAGYSAGGIAGVNSGSISNCEVSAGAAVQSEAEGVTVGAAPEVKGGLNAGGIAGMNTGNKVSAASIDECSVNAIVSTSEASANAGGIVGTNGSNASISNVTIGAGDNNSAIASEDKSYDIYVNAEGAQSNAGGIAGSNSGTIEEFGFTKEEAGFNYSESNETESVESLLDSASLGSVRVSITSGNVGGIAGVNEQSGSISYCATGSFWDVSAGAKGSDVEGAGGIVGFNSSSSGIRNCYNQATVTKAADKAAAIGGIVGYSQPSGSGYSLLNCINYGSISGQGMVGGIAGEWAGSGSVRGCINYGAVSFAVANAGQTDRPYMGGIVGGFANASSVTLRDCENHARISTAAGEASAFAAGIAGGSDGSGTINVIDCTNTGVLDGYHTAGITGDGFSAASSVEGCQNYGLADGSSTYFYGITGTASCEIADCFNVIDSSIASERFKDNYEPIAPREQSENTAYYFMENDGTTAGGPSGRFGVSGITMSAKTSDGWISNLLSWIFGSEVSVSNKNLESIVDGQRQKNYVNHEWDKNEKSYFNVKLSKLSVDKELQMIFNVSFNGAIKLSAVCVDWDCDVYTKSIINSRKYVDCPFTPQYELYAIDENGNNIKLADQSALSYIQSGSHYYSVYDKNVSAIGLKVVVTYMSNASEIFSRITKNGSSINIFDATDYYAIISLDDIEIEGSFPNEENPYYTLRSNVGTSGGDYMFGGKIFSNRPGLLEDDGNFMGKGSTTEIKLTPLEAYGTALFMKEDGTATDEENTTVAEFTPSPLIINWDDNLLKDDLTALKADANNERYEVWKQLTKALKDADISINLKNSKPTKPWGLAASVEENGSLKLEWLPSRFAESYDYSVSFLDKDGNVIKTVSGSELTECSDVIASGDIPADAVAIKFAVTATNEHGSTSSDEEVISIVSEDNPDTAELPTPQLSFELVRDSDGSLAYRLVLDNESDYEELEEEGYDLDDLEIVIEAGDGEMAKTNTCKPGELIEGFGDSETQIKYYAVLKGDDGSELKSEEQEADIILPTAEDIKNNALFKAEASSPDSGFRLDEDGNYTYTIQLDDVSGLAQSVEVGLITINDDGIPVMAYSKQEGLNADSTTIKEEFDIDEELVKEGFAIVAFPESFKLGSGDEAEEISCASTVKTASGKESFTAEELKKLKVKEDEAGNGKDYVSLLKADGKGGFSLAPGYIIKPNEDGSFTVLYVPLVDISKINNSGANDGTDEGVGSNTNSTYTQSVEGLEETKTPEIKAYLVSGSATSPEKTELKDGESAQLAKGYVELSWGDEDDKISYTYIITATRSDGTEVEIASGSGSGWSQQSGTTTIDLSRYTSISVKVTAKGSADDGFITSLPSATEFELPLGAQLSALDAPTAEQKEEGSSIYSISWTPSPDNERQYVDHYEVIIRVKDGEDFAKENAQQTEVDGFTAYELKAKDGSTLCLWVEIPGDSDKTSLDVDLAGFAGKEVEVLVKAVAKDGSSGTVQGPSFNDSNSTPTQITIPAKHETPDIASDGRLKLSYAKDETITDANAVLTDTFKDALTLEMSGGSGAGQYEIVMSVTNAAGDESAYIGENGTLKETEKAINAKKQEILDQGMIDAVNTLRGTLVNGTEAAATSFSKAIDKLIDAEKERINEAAKAELEKLDADSILSATEKSKKEQEIKAAAAQSCAAVEELFYGREATEGSQAKTGIIDSFNEQLKAVDTVSIANAADNLNLAKINLENALKRLTTAANLNAVIKTLDTDKLLSDQAKTAETLAGAFAEKQSSSKEAGERLCDEIYAAAKTKAEGVDEEAVAEEQTLIMSGSDLSSAVYVIKGLETKYAAGALTVKLRAVGNGSISSDWSEEKSFALPAVRIDTPRVSQSQTSDPQTYTRTWTDDNGNEQSDKQQFTQKIYSFEAVENASSYDVSIVTNAREKKIGSETYYSNELITFTIVEENGGWYIKDYSSTENEGEQKVESRSATGASLSWPVIRPDGNNRCNIGYKAVGTYDKYSMEIGSWVRRTVNRDGNNEYQIFVPDGWESSNRMIVIEDLAEISVVAAAKNPDGQKCYYDSKYFDLYRSTENASWQSNAERTGVSAVAPPSGVAMEESKNTTYAYEGTLWQSDSRAYVIETTVRRSDYSVTVRRLAVPWKALGGSSKLSRIFLNEEYFALNNSQSGSFRISARIRTVDLSSGVVGKWSESFNLSDGGRLDFTALSKKLYSEVSASSSTEEYTLETAESTEDNTRSGETAEDVTVDVNVNTYTWTWDDSTDKLSGFKVKLNYTDNTDNSSKTAEWSWSPEQWNADRDGWTEKNATLEKEAAYKLEYEEETTEEESSEEETTEEETSEEETTEEETSEEETTREETTEEETTEEDTTEESSTAEEKTTAESTTEERTTEPTTPERTTEATTPEPTTAAYLTGIAASYTGGQKTAGEQLLAGEISVAGSYSDGGTAQITDGFAYDLQGVALTEGVHAVNVSYGGFTTSFELNVGPAYVTGITAGYAGPAKTAGEYLSAGEIAVTASYSDGHTAQITDGFAYDLQGVALTEGVHAVNISYSGFTVSFELSVGPAYITGISAAYTGGAKTAGDYLNAGEITVTASYSDGHTAQTADGVGCDRFGTELAEGSNTVTVSYGGFTASVEIWAAPRPTEATTAATEPASSALQPESSTDVPAVQSDTEAQSDAAASIIRHEYVLRAASQTIDKKGYIHFTMKLTAELTVEAREHNGATTYTFSLSVPTSLVKMPEGVTDESGKQAKLPFTVNSISVEGVLQNADKAYYRSDINSDEITITK